MECNNSLNDLLHGLNENQKEGVLYISGALLLLAGAGSGKTLVITKKIAYLIKECYVSPENILAVTFTNKAALEMRARVLKFLPEIRGYRINVRTFHSICLRILREDGKYLGYRDNFLVIDEYDKRSIIKKIAKSNNITIPKSIGIINIAKIISSAKNSDDDPLEYIKLLRLEGDVVTKLYEKYIEYMLYENIMDFDDLLINAIKLFRQEKAVLNYYRNKWKYILVDEFQDTNTIQYNFIKMLTKNNDNQLTIVGDDDQSIYAFRGAVVKNILNFKDDYDNVHIIKLEENYRCPKDVVEIALNIIKNNKGRHEKNVFSNKINSHRVEEWECMTDIDESKSVVTEIEELFNQGFNASDIVILFRANSQSRLYEKELLTHKIDYKIVGGVGFYERAEVKDSIAYLRLICGIRDNASLRRIINTPHRTIGEKTISMLDDFAYSKNISLYEAMKNAENIGISKKAAASILSLRTLIDYYSAIVEDDLSQNNGNNIEHIFFEFLNKIKYFSIFDEKEDSFRTITAEENIKEVFRAYYEYKESELNSDITSFLTDVSIIKNNTPTNVQDDGKKEYITLMTVHNSKGLEFNCVFLTGLEMGTFPHFFAIEEGDNAIEEERRLCYVAITRAKERLYLTFSKRRKMNMGVEFKNPSIFLKEIPAHLLKKRIMSPSGNDNYIEIDDDAFEY